MTEICEECGCEMVPQEGCLRCPACGEGPACGGVTIHPEKTVVVVGDEQARDKPLVYLAGPYTRPDPVENVHKACKAADEVLAMGMIPFIPHLTHTYHLVSPKPVEFWYDYDIHMLRRCDVVLRLPGDSTGADREVAEAEGIGIPVVHGLDALKSWGVHHADDSPMPEDLARQMAFLEGYLARRQDVPAEEIPACIERFIRGRRDHDFSPDWRGIDFAAEIDEERRDIWNYEGMEAMLEAGL